MSDLAELNESIERVTVKAAALRAERDRYRAALEEASRAASFARALRIISEALNPQPTPRESR